MTNRTPSFTSPRETLRYEHAMLDTLCDDLINRAESDDWRNCDAVWDEFGRVLEAHMRLEEATLLPVFAAEGPEQAHVAERLRGEHHDIRRAVERLGIAVQLHTLRADDVRELIAMLRGHAALEDSSLYSWAERAASPSARPPLDASAPPAPPAPPAAV